MQQVERGERHASMQAKRCVSGVRCPQSRASSASCSRRSNTPLSKPVKSAILAQYRRESGECRLNDLGGRTFRLEAAKVRGAYLGRPFARAGGQAFRGTRPATSEVGRRTFEYGGNK